MLYVGELVMTQTGKTFLLGKLFREPGFARIKSTINFTLEHGQAEVKLKVEF